MKTRLKIIVVFVLLSFSLSIMSNTYSRYLTDTTGDVEMVFAKWQMLVNNEDITSSNVSSLEITPVIEENENVASNKLAPSSKGYFDITIDPSNVDVSFNYIIAVENNEDMPDLVIDKYTIITDDITNEETEYFNITENQIKNSLSIDKTIEDFKFSPFTVRVFFSWYDEEDNIMDDSDDTQFVESHEDVKILTRITFEQKLN